MKRACKQCEFFHPLEGVTDDATKQPLGQCRVRAPVLVQNLIATKYRHGGKIIGGNHFAPGQLEESRAAFNHATMWPLLKEEDWCGEFQPMPVNYASEMEPKQPGMDEDHLLRRY